MSTSIVTLAAAVTTELATIDTGEPTTIARAYLPKKDLQDFNTLRLTVLIQSSDLSPMTRGADQDVQEVAVAVQKRVDPDDLDAVDALVQLTETIAAHFRRRELATCPDAHHQETTIDHSAYREWLREHRLFTSLITLQYRQM